MGVGEDRRLGGILVGVAVVTGVHGIIGVGRVHAGVILRVILGRVLCWRFCWRRGEALGGSFFIREVIAFP